MISRAALKILMAAMYKMPVMLMSIFIFCLSTTYGLRNPLICDPRLVIPQCQYPTACYCDQLPRLGAAFRTLYYYDKITNRCRSL
ncbi:uncharacterized protein LOC119186173 isoform X2 [Rhipicephalus microplus]|uniref:uncharacterized protein LOC119186173 isoform X2 n=1 Tax=Rhipicephalus microplus TaxID=6941 RepID=UPI003F6C5363